jgi:hypothetical protein
MPGLRTKCSVRREERNYCSSSRVDNYIICTCPPQKHLTKPWEIMCRFGLFPTKTADIVDVKAILAAASCGLIYRFNEAAFNTVATSNYMNLVGV